MQNLLEELKEALTQEPKYLVDGQLFKNKIVEDALKLEPSLLKLIARNDNIKRHFFVDVDGMVVFDKVKFQEFVNNKNFLPDSYTAFKNKIGLNDGKTYLKNTNDVVLSWAYKDCILEGGMTKEEVKSNVPEIFYNTNLAPDEITKLLSQKVLSSFQLWDEEAVKLGKAKKPSDIIENDNLLIKGNNLLALHSLKKRYSGKVKLIYIDPPYNTGNDGFHYNDSFNHSSWLTFMKNRLEIARLFLTNDGVIFVHCDNNEQAYLKVLMDDIFGIENFIETITVVNNPRGRDYGGVANMHEFMLVYSNTKTYSLNKVVDETKEFPFKDKISGFEIRELRNRNVAFNDKNRPNLFYSFYANPKNKDENGFYEISLEYKDGWILINPAISQGIQTVWRWGKTKSQDNLNINIVARKMTTNDGWQIVEKYRDNSRMARSVWWDKEVNSEKGTLHLKEVFGGKLFAHPKPEGLLKRVIEIATNKDDIVLDFFSGSGTTPSVAHKMGRRWIAIEQMDYIKDLPEARLKKVIEGEQGGISKAVNWQGGGSFVYCELKEWNEDFIQKARKAKNSKEITRVYEEMKEQAFFRYDFDSKKFDNKAFSELEFADQQKVLIDMLDKNHLYVNYSEIEDSRYDVSDEEKELSAKFYGDK